MDLFLGFALFLPPKRTFSLLRLYRPSKMVAEIYWQSDTRARSRRWLTIYSSNKGRSPKQPHKAFFFILFICDKMGLFPPIQIIRHMQNQLMHFQILLEEPW